MRNTIVSLALAVIACLAALDALFLTDDVDSTRESIATHPVAITRAEYEARLSELSARLERTNYSVRAEMTYPVIARPTLICLVDQCDNTPTAGYGGPQLQRSTETSYRRLPDKVRIDRVDEGEIGADSVIIITPTVSIDCSSRFCFGAPYYCPCDANSVRAFVGLTDAIEPSQGEPFLRNLPGIKSFSTRQMRVAGEPATCLSLVHPQFTRESCYAHDGIPLLSIANTNGIIPTEWRAVSVNRDVPDAQLFEQPLPTFDAEAFDELLRSIEEQLDRYQEWSED